jgi:hypothetical protein
MRCLASAMAAGRSLKSWAEAHGLNVTMVRESSRLPKVTELVALYRSRKGLGDLNHCVSEVKKANRI